MVGHVYKWTWSTCCFECDGEAGTYLDWSGREGTYRNEFDLNVVLLNIYNRKNVKLNKYIKFLQ